MSLYVDDIVYTGSCPKLLENFNNDIMSQSKMADLGLLHHFLGMSCSDWGKHFHSSEKVCNETNWDIWLKRLQISPTLFTMNEKLSIINGSEVAYECEFRNL